MMLAWYDALRDEPVYLPAGVHIVARFGRALYWAYLAPRFWFKRKSFTRASEFLTFEMPRSLVDRFGWKLKRHDGSPA